MGSDQKSRVGINSRCLEYGVTGIERYCLELVKGLQQRGRDVSMLSQKSIQTIADSVGVENYYSDVSNSSGALAKLIWEAHGVKALIEKADLDIYHAPSFILPIFFDRDVKKIVTVHDLAFLRLPQCFTSKEKLYYKLMLSNSLRQADKIIAISNSTKSDIEYFFPHLVDKVEVVYNGFEDFGLIEPDQAYVQNLNLEEGEFFLVVGVANKRKNLSRVLDAYSQYRKSSRFKKRLLIVGSVAVEDRVDIEGVVYTGRVSDSQLSALYRDCCAFIYASLYEGFGFPILEAMSVGCPVITSNISSMPEVSGLDSSLLIDPCKASSIRNMMLRLESDKRMLAELGGDGISQSKLFSWEKMVKETIELY